MSDPRDLVLEQALAQVFGAPLADLTPGVLEGWRRGDSGTHGTRAPAATRAPRRRWRFAALAAAAVLAVLWLARERGAAPTSVTSDVPVVASDPGPWRPSATLRLHAGQTVHAERDAALALGGGVGLELVAGAVIRLEAAGPQAAVLLLAGELTLTSAVRPALLRVGAARVELAPGACVRARTPDFTDSYVTPPSSLPFLPRDLHMNHIAPATAALFTLLAGHADLADAGGSRPLPPHVAVASDDGAADDPVREQMKLEAGTWDLSITDLRDGQPVGKRTGTEVCTLPSTGEWLLSDTTMERAGGPTVWAHVVLGYQPEKRLWSGSLVDSFGGDMALVAGTAGEDPTVRVVSMLRFSDKSAYGTRATMRWVSDDERLTVWEDLVGEDWVVLREVVHKRRK